MKVIGITGGVGAGKSEILSYLKEHCNCRIIMADRLAETLEEPGQVCYDRLVALLGRDILQEDGRIDRQKMAAEIFADSNLLAAVNYIIHPAVKEYILQIIETEKAAARLDYLFIEAALLIEDGYDKIVDELWYIHTDTDIRRQRLKASRGYTDEKIDHILKGQLSEEEFYGHCHTVIENSGTLESVYKQIEEKLGEDLCQKQ
ncbi:MAG: dephospho-CoA kinase [Lachnospiraceae bacterium]|nr:dephospho-CoA kinase [Lachnospiraceae bacterium]